MKYVYVKADNLWSPNAVALKPEVSFSDFSLRKQLDTKGIWTSLEDRSNTVNKRLTEFILCSVITEIRKHETTTVFLSLTNFPRPWPNSSMQLRCFVFCVFHLFPSMLLCLFSLSKKAKYSQLFYINVWFVEMCFRSMESLEIEKHNLYFWKPSHFLYLQTWLISQIEKQPSSHFMFRLIYV